MNSSLPAQTWQSVRDEVLDRIARKVWKPGDSIPNEADLAVELGCARATVNRALRSLSEDGLLERRRKGGTRVARDPVSKATILIPIMRAEIEQGGQRYGYRLLERRVEPAPEHIAIGLGLKAGTRLLHVVSVHSADGAAYALEDRWIVPDSVPEALEQTFETLSANEWLVRHLPFTRAESAFRAVSAGPTEKAILSAETGDALIVHRRATWMADAPITHVEMTFANGHQIQA